MAVAQQLAVHVQRQVQNGIVHTHGAHRHLEGWRGRAVCEEGIADRLRLLERTQQPFTARQRFTVDARHKAPVRLGGVHLVGQVVAEKGVHQSGARREHAGEIVRRHLGAGAAHQRITPGNRLTAEPTHFHVNALTHVLQIATLSVAAGADGHIAEHGLQPARQTSRAGLQAADCIAARRRHTAVCRILNGGQIAIKLVNLLKKIIKYDGLAALLQRLRQLNHRRIVVGHQLFRRLRHNRALRRGIVTVAEQCFQRAGGAVALVFRFLRIFRRRRSARQGQHLAQVK